MLQNFLHDRQFHFLLCLLCSLALLLGCSRRKSPQNYFPESGKQALYQHSLDVRSNLNVLSIALQPGYEDFVALAYLRLGRGATIKSAYVTNCEAGESDVQAEYPPYLAVRRRAEAARAMALLDGEAHFLNLPDIAAARDSAKVRELWPSDTLQARLTRLLAQFKPEIIIMPRDWPAAGTSVRWEVLCADLLTAAKNLPPLNATPGATNSASKAWEVQRVLVDDGAGNGINVPIEERHPRWKKSYQEIGEEMASAYASLSSQRRLWLKNAVVPSYRLAYPPGAAPASLDEGLPSPSSARLRPLEEEIRQITAYTQEGKTTGILKRMLAVMDSLDYQLAVNISLLARERKALLHWKRELDELRCAMLGVHLEYAVDDTLVTDRQVALLKITEVKGMAKEAKTEVYFAGLDEGWAINEYVERKLPLELNTDYRLLSPGALSYHFPPGQYEVKSSSIGFPFYFFIIHRATPRELSFVKRTAVNLLFSPKLAVEVLTPAVRMGSGERIVVRLRNVSRDGLADTLGVNDSLAVAFGHPIHLPTKGNTLTDTLSLAWQGDPPDGDYLIPIDIGGTPVAKFLARKFHAEVDAGRRAGLISGVAGSPTGEALRRLGVSFSRITPGRSLARDIETLDVLLIDRRALTLQPQLADFKETLNQFCNRGGRLIVLAQDAAAWNAKPLWEGMRLSPTLEMDASFDVQMDPSHPLLTTPNLITPEDWNDWLFQRAHNRVSVETLAAAAVPVSAGQHPLIVSFAEGRGRKTYVDLALQPQLMNLHPGTFRLLANLISY